MEPTYRILIASDLSAPAELALASALEEARRVGEIELHVVSVIDDSTHHLLPEDHHTTLMRSTERAHDLLARQVSAVMTRAPALPRPTLHIRLGNVVEQISSLAGEIGADLLVVGTHGRHGLKAHLLGSTAERLVRFAPCTVLVARAKDTHVMDNVPKVEPPCPDCVQTRAATHGTKWWCDRHAQAPEPAHTYSWSGRLDEAATPRHDML